MGNVVGKSESVEERRIAHARKLQRRDNVLKFLGVVVHASGVACFAYAIYASPIFSGEVPVHLASNAVLLAMRQYPGKWKYLTTWNVVLQLGYHCTALVNDFFGSSEIHPKRQTKLQRVRDVVFAGWAFPIGMYVSTSFWGFYAINRKLVFPIEADGFYPTWLNHSVHTAPALLIMLDLLTTKRPEYYCCPGIRRNLEFMAVYIAWITWIQKHNGVWPYPIINMSNGWQRALLFGGMFLGSAGFYGVGKKLVRLKQGRHTSWWGGSRHAKAPKARKK